MTFAPSDDHAPARRLELPLAYEADFHRHYDVDAVVGDGPVPRRYTVGYPHPHGRALLTIPFLSLASADATPALDGVTFEVLLAVMIDRLNCFQRGLHACLENDVALGHLVHARDALSIRSRRVMKEKNERAAEAVPPRVRREGDQLVVGDASIPLGALRYWSGWPAVESAVKALIRRDKFTLTTAELDAIRAAAETDAAKNGLREFESAYSTMG